MKCLTLRGTTDKSLLSLLAASMDGGRVIITDSLPHVMIKPLTPLLDELTDIGILDQDLSIRRGRFNDLLTFIVNKGLATDELAKALSWRGFEALVDDILSNNGFITSRNVRIRRNEIDVIATTDHFALSIDCKHWSRASFTALRNAAVNQIERTKKMSSAFTGVSVILPSIVTLVVPPQRIIEGVPVVVINELSEFSLSLPGDLELFTLIRSGPVA